ncbi:DCC1-like thiol-disulfide oxidoreductase family protein [Psychromarinibacter sp. C21-152]|uniref:DCC1-like thiol-disulfide oxidoreductase family protein n=1 Tax=Psychromarinibacter sediminicola TaxID=3033385 RepID=A0AAE3NQC3_9RHOB|nr:DCC1-like thiol-disulfide oxidoreductase family protein [Psychromarinibacter sediminicola]MDF0600147.1 DCC1-like thiol-disulfide oxidoreductase family protein [Psychromarinibacter sediminicola]
MNTVATLPADLRAALAGRDVIVFDGECVLCSGFFRFMLRRDRDRRFAFATAQSELGQRLYRALDLPIDRLETNLVIVDGRIHRKLDAFAAAMRALPAPWPVLGVVRHLPRVVKDPAYNVIARNRYRLFGRYDSCLVPGPDVRARFLPDGFALG